MSRGTISSVAVLACLLVNAAVSSPLRNAEHSTSHHASHHLTRADAKAAALQSRINEYDKRSGVERQLINRILKENKRTISKSDAEALNKFIVSSQNILADIAKYSGPNLDAMEEVRESMLAKIKQIDTKLKERRLDLKKTELNTKSNSTSLKTSDKELNSTANKTALASDAKLSKDSSQTANNETKPAAAADRASKVLEDILTKFKKLEERVEKKGKERDLEEKKAKEEKERKEKDDKYKEDKDKKEKDAAKEAEKNKERKISDKAKEESKVAANKKANEPLTPDDDSPRGAPASSGGGGGSSQPMFNNGGGGGGLPTWNMQPQNQQMMGMTMSPDGRSDLISGYASQDANSLKQVGTSADRALDSLGNGFIDGGTLNSNMMGGTQSMMGPTGMQQPMEGGMDQGMDQTQSFGPPSSQGAPSILGQSSENLGEQENFDQMPGAMEVAGAGAPEQFEERGHEQGQTEEMYGGEEMDESHHHHHHHHGHHHRGHHHDDAEEAAQIAQQFMQPGDQGTGAAGYEMSQDTQGEPFMHEVRGATTEVFDAGRGHGPSVGLLTGGGFVNSKSPSQLGAPQAHDNVPQFGAVMGAKARAKTPAAVLSSQPNGAPPLLDRSRGISGFSAGQTMKPASFSLLPGAFMGPTQVDPADKLLADLQQKQLSSNEFEAMMNMNRQRMMSDGMSGFLPQSGQPGFPGSPGYGRGMDSFTDPNMGRSMGQQISDVVGQAPGVARGMARSFGQGAPLPVAGIQTGMQPGFGPMFGPTIGMSPFGGSGMLGGKFKKDKVKKRTNRKKKKRSRVARLSNHKRSRVSRKHKRGHIAKQHKRRHIGRRQDKMDRDLVLIRSL